MLKTKSSDDKLDTLLSRSVVPIIDLAHCGIEEVPVKSVVNRVGHQLKKALSEKGMALLVNHGISDEKLKTAWDHLDDFVDLPPDVKQHYIRTDGDKHGYVSRGQERYAGKPGAPDLRHAFNICTLNAQNLPEEPLPGFADHISTLATDFKALASFILQSLAVSLDIPPTFFLEKHSHMLSGDHDNMTSLRMLYYPPIVDDEPGQNDSIKGRCLYSYQRCLSNQPDFRPENNPRDDAELNELDGPNGQLFEHKLGNGAVITCPPHVDYGTFTLLAQDSEGGLEVKLPGSEKWHRVGHLPGSILVNCGQILNTWTQERYPALQHRVVVPEQESVRSRGRHSIAYFCHPDNITTISPNDLPNPDAALDGACLKQRKKSFKAAKERVYNAYQLIQKKFRDTYSNNNHS